MAKCSKIKIPDSSICVGDMKHRIELQSRSIQPPPLQSPDYDLEFVTLITVWAAIRTFPRVSQFDESNIEQTVSHNFYIRFMPNIPITAENWILFNSVRYKIVDTENLQEDDDILKLISTVRGNDTKRTNFR